MTTFHMHLVSDSTGETVVAIARACISQFDDVHAIEHPWLLVRTEHQVERVIEGVVINRGIVLYTLVDNAVRSKLEDGCRRLGIPCIPVLDPVMGAMAGFLGAEIRALPGRQHALDAEYFRRMDAINFTLAHDDGQIVDDLNDADVVIVGVSRTSKTPTCMYLANRGIKAVNIPFVAGMAPPDGLLTATRPLIVALTRDPDNLTDIRRIRVEVMHDSPSTAYADFENVREELKEARRLFSRHRWPVLDMTHRSIEEAAAVIMDLLVIAKSWLTEHILRTDMRYVEHVKQQGQV
ncbi:MAG: pyruvate, phosphate dikinase/phosphoenolpyruvate synthase regulator [Alphaproteobacteria bacterium]